jgi:tetratricopeptide (TPR) repeat protein
MANRKTCFVIIGYDTKTDFSSGQQYNLENSYDNLIKPVFTNLGIDCFRAKDKKHSGVIDAHMYKWILEADIVVADLTTWNPNVLYELGIRHAVKPYTTILISDEKIKSAKVPFDLSHDSISFYKHLGEDIGAGEAKRFSKVLEDLVREIMNKDEVDSPVYTFLHDLSPPSKNKHIVAPVNLPELPKTSASDLAKLAEAAKSREEYPLAKTLFEEALKLDPQNSFLHQRRALVTYKADPKSLEKLEEAEKMLDVLDPVNTTDPETLGLLGAIKKRMFDTSNKQHYLDSSIKFYARGFYVKQDYYNGVNLAFMLTVKASICDDKIECTGYWAHSNLVRQQVIDSCLAIIQGPDFDDRKDKNWLYLTLAEGYLGLGKENEIDPLLPLIQKYSEGKFDRTTFDQQTGKLRTLMDIIKKKIN